MVHLNNEYHYLVVNMEIHNIYKHIHFQLMYIYQLFDVLFEYKLKQRKREIVWLIKMVKLLLVLHNFVVLFQHKLGFAIHVTMQNGTSIIKVVNIMYYTSLLITKLIVWLQHNKEAMK